MPGAGGRRIGVRRYGRLLRPVVDPGRDFRGAAEPVRRVVRYGSCEFRSMDTAHGLATPVGYPAVAVAVLEAEHRIATAWQNIFSLSFEDLPRDRRRLVEHYKLEGPPDVVIVGVGAVYAAVNVLGDHATLMNVRNHLALRTPAAVSRWTYRTFDRPLARLGRPARHYAGPAYLSAFVGLVRRTWSDAELFLEPPLPVRDGGWWRKTMIDTVRADVAETASAWRLPLVDHAEFLGDADALRCYNAYNLNTSGSAIVGRHWAERLAHLWA